MGTSIYTDDEFARLTKKKNELREEVNQLIEKREELKTILKEMNDPVHSAKEAQRKMKKKIVGQILLHVGASIVLFMVLQFFGSLACYKPDARYSDTKVAINIRGLTHLRWYILYLIGGINLLVIGYHLRK